MTATVRRTRKIVVVVINLAVAAVQLLTGPGYRGPGRAFVTGYPIDIALPFSAYFLLVLCEDLVPPLRSWIFRSATVFAVISCAEVAQFFGLPVFGSTFDPWDFAAYSAGALFAAYMDRIVLPLLVGSWVER